MYPYWLLGAGVLVGTWLAGYKKDIRIEKPALKEWARFLGVITVLRVILFKFLPHQHIQEVAKNISVIPWPLTLTVFWEDACHGLPLLLIQRLIGTKKWTWPIHGFLIGLVMLEFGLGHVYQGLWAALFLSCYVPYSIKLGKKYGFGTVMIGHTMFDLVTILTVKLLTAL